MFFRTPKDATYDVDIVNVGYCSPGGELGVSVEHAAKLMHELQDEDGNPLEGKALEKAAKEWGAGFGLVIVKTEPPQGASEFPVEAAEPLEDAEAEEEVG